MHLSETYMYYDLPFCRPAEMIHKPESLGEVVEGNRLVKTNYSIQFRTDREATSLCTRQLNAEDLERFRKARFARPGKRTPRIARTSCAAMASSRGSPLGRAAAATASPRRFIPCDVFLCLACTLPSATSPARGSCPSPATTLP
jgi:hypothetical protein